MIRKRHRLVERQPDELRAAEAVATLIPDFKPVLEDAFMDDEGRLWVNGLSRPTPRRSSTFSPTTATTWAPSA